MGSSFWKFALHGDTRQRSMSHIQSPAPLGVASEKYAATAAKRLVLIYAVFASLWILVSDSLAAWLFRDPVLFTRASMVKGWFFVVVTTLLLYGLVRRMQTRLHEREAHFRRFFEMNSTVMMFIDPESGRISEANERASAFYGYAMDTLVGMSIDQINVLSPELVAAERQRALREERNYFQFSHRLASGEVRDVEVHSTPINSGGRVQLLSIIHDITDRKRAEDMLRKLYIAIEQSPTSVVITDLEACVQYVNPRFTQVTGYTADEVLGKNPRLLQSGTTPAEVYQAMWSCLTHGQVWTGELVNKRKTGEIYWEEAHIAPVKDESGVVTHYVAVKTDITQRKQFELTLAESEIRLRTLIQTIPDLIWLKDPQGVYLACNSRFEQFFGAKEVDIVGKTDYDFVDKELADFFRENDQAAICKGGPSVNEEWVTFAEDGHRELLETTKTPVVNAQGVVIGVLGIGHDMTERHVATDKIAHLAFYDSLTDLPNRRLMLDRLEQALTSSARHGRRGALMLLDLGNFKLLNDTLGHAAGDQLLVAVAARLRSSIREGDTVARMGGDEFVIILNDLDENDLAAVQAEQVASKILVNLSEPYTLDLVEGKEYDRKRVHQCTSSISITLFRDQTVSVDELMKRADTAMYQAKSAGRNALRFFDLEMQTVVAQRASIELDLRKAIAENQFVLHYQAQVDSLDQVFGVEALVRWQHPVRGLVPPLEFISLAEETGLILPLGQWVLETACAQLAQWSKTSDLSALTMAVNVSALQMKSSDFVEQVLATVARHQVPLGKLKLELTESLLLDNAEEVIEKMLALKAHGIGFSLDDFGTGYSSLSYLKRLPLDQLKIDQSFVRDVLTDANDAAIAGTVVALGRSLGLDVIAEGVESLAQRNFLESNDCHAYQGYFFSRPLPKVEFEAFVRANPKNHMQG